MKRVAQITASLVLGGLLLYAVFRHFDFHQTITAVREAKGRLRDLV